MILVIQTFHKYDNKLTNLLFHFTYITLTIFGDIFPLFTQFYSNPLSHNFLSISCHVVTCVCLIIILHLYRCIANTHADVKQPL